MEGTVQKQAFGEAYSELRRDSTETSRTNQWVAGAPRSFAWRTRRGSLMSCVGFTCPAAPERYGCSGCIVWKAGQILAEPNFKWGGSNEKIIQGLPFSLREIQEKFGVMARISLKQLAQAGIVHNFPQLIEKSHQPVSQAEHTVIIKKEGVEVTTR